jgi:hypothetical protein
MTTIISWLRENKFEAHLTTFLLMVFSSILLFFSGRVEGAGLTWILIAIFVLANILAMLI